MLSKCYFVYSPNKRHNLKSPHKITYNIICLYIIDIENALSTSHYRINCITKKISNNI